MSTARAEIDLAALHLARVYGDETTDRRVLRRWSDRIRLWASRGRVHQYGQVGHRKVYDLTELREAATRAFGPPRLTSP